MNFMKDSISLFLCVLFIFLNGNRVHAQNYMQGCSQPSQVVVFTFQGDNQGTQQQLQLQYTGYASYSTDAPPICSGIATPGKTTEIAINPGGTVISRNQVQSQNQYQISYPVIFCWGTSDYQVHPTGDATITRQNGCSTCIPASALPPPPQFNQNQRPPHLGLQVIGWLTSKGCSVASCLTLPTTCPQDNTNNYNYNGPSVASGQSLQMATNNLTLSVGNIYGNLGQRPNQPNVIPYQVPWTYVTLYVPFPPPSNSYYSNSIPMNYNPTPPAGGVAQQSTYSLYNPLSFLTGGASGGTSATTSATMSTVPPAVAFQSGFTPSSTTTSSNPWGSGYSSTNSMFGSGYGPSNPQSSAFTSTTTTNTIPNSNQNYLNSPMYSMPQQQAGATNPNFFK